MIDKNLLYSIGLDDNEIEIYNLLLREGEIGIGKILSETTLKRGTIYNILYDLIKKELIDESEFRGKKTFLPKSPLVIDQIYQAKIKNLQANQLHLQEILPKILVEHKLTTKTPLISSFKGIDGLEKIYDHVLKIRQPLSIFISYVDRADPRFSELIDRQIKRQSRIGIKVRSLGHRVNYSKEYWNFAKTNGIQIKVLGEKFKLPAQILIYGDNVAYTAFENEFISTLISNSVIARTMQTIFETIWLQAKIPNIIDQPMAKKEVPNID